MKVNKCKKLVCNLYDNIKIDYIRSSKEVLNHGLKMKRIHKVLKFNQRAWLKSYFDKNTDLRKNAENDFEKDIYKLMNNAVYGKTMENVRKHRIIKLVNNDKKRNKLASEPNYHTTKWFSENLLALEMKETLVKMNKPIYVGLPILSLSKILMYDYWYNEMKPKYKDEIRLCYMDMDSFIMYIKTENFYKDIADDVERTYDASNYTVERPLPMGENKKKFGFMKDELGGRIKKEFIGLRPR